jgi:hypothetical protein
MCFDDGFDRWVEHDLDCMGAIHHVQRADLLLSLGELYTPDFGTIGELLFDVS